MSAHETPTDVIRGLTDGEVAGIRGGVRPFEATPPEPPTLRDRFAMAALPTLIVQSFKSNERPEDVAVYAYRFADLMLEARKK